MIVGQLFYNLSVLVAFAVFSDLVNRLVKIKRNLNSVIQGIIFGIATIVAMMNPFVLSEGLIFDGRSVMLGLCTLFFGPIAGVVSFSFAFLYRLYIGGAGLLVGELVSLFSVIIGATFYYYFVILKKKLPSIYGLYLFGVLVHVVMLSVFTLLPIDLASKTFQTIALTVIVFYPIGTVLIGFLIKNQILHAQLLDELQLEKDYLASTLNSIGEGVISVDVNGNVMHLNLLAKKMCEIAEKDAVDTPIHSILHLFEDENSDSILLSKETFDEVKQTGKSKLLFDQLFLISPSKSKYHIVCNFSPIINRKNEFLGEVITFSDLEQQDRLSHSLLQSEAMFKAVFDSSASAIGILTMDGSFVETNQAFNALIGYDSDFLIQHNYSFVDITYIEDRELGTQLFKKLVESSNVLLAYEKRFITKDGKILWGIVTSSVVRNEYGVPQYLVSQIVDISERKAIEEELKNHNNQLIQLTTELSIAKEKAEKSDALKTAFLGNMSHEIRTPMNGIIGVADLLIDNSLDENDRRGFVNIMQLSCNRLLNTINDIIEAAKIDSDQIQIANTEFSLNIMLDSIVSKFTPLFEEKNVGFSLLIEDSVDKDILLYGDDEKLNIILNKLISNALKFTVQGQVSVMCKYQNPFYVFEIKDTGVGIDAEYIPKLFDNFTQEDVSINRGYEGTGLGLAIARGYAKALNGELLVASKKDEGTTFCLKLPLSLTMNIKSLISTNMQNSTNPIALETLSFLIAEDDDISFILAQKILSHEFGAKIIRAKNGIEAIDIFSKDKTIALVLMDIKMPKMDGFECVQQLRLISNDVPIIAVTAFAFAKDKERAMEVGCNDYISKPYIAHTLVEKIRSFVG